MKFNKGYNVTEVMNQFLSERNLETDYKVSRLYIEEDLWDVWIYRVHENSNKNFEFSRGQYFVETINIPRGEVYAKLVKEFGYAEYDFHQEDERPLLKDIQSIRDVAKSCILIDLSNNLWNWNENDNYWDIDSIEDEIGFNDSISIISCS